MQDAARDGAALAGGSLGLGPSPANSPPSIPFRTTAERAPEVRLCAAARDLYESCLLGIIIRNLATDLHPAASAGLQHVECSKGSS